MNIFKVFAFVVACCLFSSCFQEEALNAEADITQAWVHSENMESTFFSATDTVVNVLYTDSNVVFNARHSADITAMSPYFKITEGATIEPANGSMHDFSNGAVRYTVTSEDGMWHRNYNVSFNKITKTVGDTINYDFENYELNPSSQKYYVWHDELGGGNFGNNWANGNEGFAITAGGTAAANYPTAPLANGYKGAGLCLTTCSTGALGALVKKPIAAGNMFLGSFNVQNALGDALTATLFGIPFDKKPIKVTGYYKYTPGKNYTDLNGNTVTGKTDAADIYAVLYRNQDDKGKAVVLDGTNIKTSPLIAGLAEMPVVKPTTEWTKFEITFIYSSDIDPDILNNRGYSFTVVFSSSIDGALFSGAIGSQLLIDNVQIISSEVQE